MKFIKKGLIYSVDKISSWAYTHTHKPTPLILNDSTIRVYFGTRDKNNHTRTTFIDLDASKIDNINVIYVHNKPILEPGETGCFDDCGANVSSVIYHNQLIYLYYIGWNPGVTVPTRNSIGLAISEDGGFTFNKPFKGPILDRNKNDPFYIGAVDIIKDGAIWKMWYTSGTKWVSLKGKLEIKYHIKYAESKNGIDWIRNNIDCVLPENEYEACARPNVLFEKGLYKMFYSKRSIDDFRISSNKSYRGGYAESRDGKKWKRLDHLFNIKPELNNWDSKAIAYPYVFKFNNKYIMLYNGNEFGKTGFGYAVANSI